MNQPIKPRRHLPMTLLYVLALLPVPFAFADNGHRHQEDGFSGRGYSERVSTQRAFRRPIYPAPGHRVAVIPDRHADVRVGSHRYKYADGVFYRPAPHGAYVVVHAPIGARIHHVPPGYVSFFVGPRHYFYANFTYYLWDQPTSEYVVVEEPEGAQRAVLAASESGSGELYVYPRLGQDEAQRDRDRYECYVWAVDQTGFDPANPDSMPDRATDYRRANAACLEGRGYTVK